MWTTPPRIKLRPYQRLAVEAVLTRLRAGKRAQMLYLPTGAGKTVIAAGIIRELRKWPNFGDVLFVAHRREILDQTARTLHALMPDVTVQIEQGERTAAKKTNVTIASVQSLVRRKERYDPTDFSLIVCDECHRALAPSWGEVIDYFSTNSGSDTWLLGMTATPKRSDGRSAMEVFGEVAFEISRADLEDLGYLVPMDYYAVRSELGLDKVKLSGGDFQVQALSQVMNRPEVRALIQKAWLEQGRGKKTIVFCAGVEHAHTIAADFVGLGVSAQNIDGKSKNRTEILREFSNGKIKVITNYGVLTEGFDDPTIECIVMARPTTSPLVYTQCLGRGLRTSPGKTACTVIDIIDRSTHPLQYGAQEMAGLPCSFRSRGGDPFRQAKSIAAIRVTSPEAFLRIRNAESLEEVQTILMSLPPEVVVAGLDGQAVLHYEALDGVCSNVEAEAAARSLLRQARAHFQGIVVDDVSVRLKLRSAGTDDERYAHLKWHLSRVTGRQIVYEALASERKLRPRALLQSMLPKAARLGELEMNADGRRLKANITGLTAADVDTVVADFESECGLELELLGQMSLF